MKLQQFVQSYYSGYIRALTVFSKKKAAKFAFGKHPVRWFSISRCMETLYSNILWIHDEGDRTTPVKDAYEVQRMKYNNVNFLFTNGLGHRKIYRDEKVVQKVTGFL